MSGVALRILSPFCVGPAPRRAAGSLRAFWLSCFLPLLLHESMMPEDVPPAVPPSAPAAPPRPAAGSGSGAPRPRFRTVRKANAPVLKKRFRRRDAGTGRPDTPPEPDLADQPLWRRMLRLHLRLVVAILMAMGVYLATSMLSFNTRFLVAWDVGVVIWLVLVMRVVIGGTAERVRRRAAEEDEGSGVILIGSLLASVFSLVAVVQEAGHSGSQPRHVLLAVGTLALSWCFMHGIYALHYAREYYAVTADTQPMLGFPGDEEPDFWDFFYFSFTVGTSAQTADVSVNSRRLRRIVLGHQLVAYGFNASVIALGVNVAASLV